MLNSIQITGISGNPTNPSHNRLNKAVKEIIDASGINQTSRGIIINYAINVCSGSEFRVIIDTQMPIGFESENYQNRFSVFIQSLKVILLQFVPDVPDDSFVFVSTREIVDTEVQANYG